MKDLCLDIETTGLNFFDVKNSEKSEGNCKVYDPEDYIISIGVWDNDFKTVFLGADIRGYALPKDNKDWSEDIHEALLQNEKEVVSKFLAHYNCLSKDIMVRLVGYNIRNFDVPFVFYKAVKHGIPLDLFKSVMRYMNSYNNLYIADSYEILRFRIFKNNFGLAKVLKSWGMKGKFEDMTGNMARDLSRDDLKKYNLQDVEIEWQLHQKLLEVGVIPK